MRSDLLLKPDFCRRTIVFTTMSVECSSNDGCLPLHCCRTWVSMALPPGRCPRGMSSLRWPGQRDHTRSPPSLVLFLVNHRCRTLSYPQGQLYMASTCIYTCSPLPWCIKGAYRAIYTVFHIALWLGQYISVVNYCGSCNCPVVWMMQFRKYVFNSRTRQDYNKHKVHACMIAGF